MSANLALRVQSTRGGFTLEVAERLQVDDVTAVFGASGSGKTSLLRAIAGLDRCSGQISFNGEVWLDTHIDVPTHARKIGFVFQDALLFPHLNVQQNLDFPRRMRRTDERIEPADVIAALSLAPLLERQVVALSGGEAQRVALGRALLCGPQLLLMDEPLSSLDAASRTQIIDYIADIPLRFGIPILYVTHDIDEVVRLAKKTLLLEGGRAVAHGPTATVLFDYDERRRGNAETSSILMATVASADPHVTTLMLADQTIKVPTLRAAQGADIQIRIRARDVVLATQRVQHISIRNALACTVTEVRDLDLRNAEILLDLAGQRLRAHITHEAVADLGLRPDMRVFAMIKTVAIDGLR
jgi:molybdate transport system ATP-binding protein